MAREGLYVFLLLFGTLYVCRAGSTWTAVAWLGPGVSRSHRPTTDLRTCTLEQLSTSSASASSSPTLTTTCSSTSRNMNISSQVPDTSALIYASATAYRHLAWRRYRRFLLSQWQHAVKLQVQNVTKIRNCYEPDAITFCVQIQNGGRLHLGLLFCNSGPPTKSIHASNVVLAYSGSQKLLRPAKGTSLRGNTRFEPSLVVVGLTWMS